MARQVRRISELPEADPLTGDELLEIVQDGGNHRVRVGDLPGGGGGGAVQSVQGRTGDVVITAADVGLGNVDNTSDANKPVSTAQQAALDGKVDKVAGMGLSSNDFTDPLRDKLIGLEGTHWRGTFVSMTALQAGVTDPEAGDYADVDVVGDDVARYIWDATDGIWVAQSGEVAPITASQVKLLYESNPDTNAFTDADEAKLGDVQPWATAPSQDAAQTALGMSSSGKTVATGTPAQGRTALGLGTAATKNVGESDGNVMEVGAGGWLGRASPNSYISGYPQDVSQNISQIYRRDSVDEGVSAFASSIHFAANDTWGRLRVGHNNQRAWIQGGTDQTGMGWTAELYHTGNILGTVSQSGGVPTGAIIERGSNANGEYVRFADGTQICCARVSVIPIANQVTSQPFTFPASFVGGSDSSNLFIVGTSITAAPETAVKSIGISSFSATGAVANIYRTNDTTTNMSVIATGRWF